jgi:hypothetical protein
MRAPYRLTLLAPALLALCSCGITTTGVVEAGGPASGIVATTSVYFVRDGALVAVPSRTARPGDAEAAVELLLVGPSREERLSGLVTLLPALPSAASSAPTTIPGAVGGPVGTPADTPRVSVEQDSMSIELPYRVAGLPGLGMEQLICTAAAAHRLGAASAGPVTVTVTAEGGWRAKGSDVHCPAP